MRMLIGVEFRVVLEVIVCVVVDISTVQFPSSCDFYIMNHHATRDHITFLYN